MRKLLFLVVALSLCLAFAGCGTSLSNLRGQVDDNCRILCKAGATLTKGSTMITRSGVCIKASVRTSVTAKVEGESGSKTETWCSCSRLENN